ncbi:MAG: agmatinase [Rhodothalassiaceae bacterium]|nr:MAG: agmatinase [Rhodothalassiaceae bacterium]
MAREKTPAPRRGTPAPLRFLPQAEGFLGLEPEAGPPVQDARVIVIPFGLEATVSYEGGTARGPEAMLAASQEVELFDEEFWCEPVARFGVRTLKPVRIAWPVERALDQLAGIVEAVVTDGRFPFVFGGEHSLTPGAIRPLAERHPDLVLLHFDAHADLRDGYDGEHYSHAAAIRRCLDDERLSVVSVGIRNISAEEIPFLEANRHRIHIHWAVDKAAWDLDAIVAPLAGRPVYVTFDLDGFDASLMPATGTPEPGGLFWDEALAVLRRAAAVARIVGADITELAPRAGLHAADFLAAKLAYKIMSYAMLGAPPADAALHRSGAGNR